MKRNRVGIIAGTLVLGLLAATGAKAASYINGSISFDAGFDCNCFAPGATSIVSMLLLIEPESPADASGGQDDFAGSNGDDTVTAGDIDLSNAPGTVAYITVSGYTFEINSVSNIMRTPMTCSGGICLDALRFRMAGTVTYAGFLPTAFIGIWTGQGTCLGASGVCDTTPSASWSASLSATGTVPEPASLAMLALGVLAVGFATWRRSLR
jgi:hypothetical protein